MRPDFPPSVVNWLPVTVSVVGPTTLASAQSNVPVYVPDRSVCSVVSAAGATVVSVEAANGTVASVAVFVFATLWRLPLRRRVVDFVGVLLPAAAF